MQLQTVLCYSYLIIFITYFLKSNSIYIQPQGQPPPPPPMTNLGCTPGVRYKLCATRGVIMVIKQLRNNIISAQNWKHLLKLKKKIKREATQYDTSLPPAIHVFILNKVSQSHETGNLSKNSWESHKCIIHVTATCILYTESTLLWMRQDSRGRKCPRSLLRLCRLHFCVYSYFCVLLL
jgi:hypothetical protein